MAGDPCSVFAIVAAAAEIHSDSYCLLTYPVADHGVACQSQMWKACLAPR